MPPVQEPRERQEASAEAALTTQQLQRNFYWFALNFAVNHGVVTTPLVLSTSVLAGDAGYVGNALINIFTMVASFFLGAPLTGTLGPRGGVLFGMLLYCIYAALFAVAAYVGKDGKDNIGETAKQLQLIIFSIGSACGGIAAGVLWTAQGAYFSRTVDLIHEREGGERSALTSKMASRFAILYLVCEVIAKLLWSLLSYLKVPGWVNGIIYTGAGALALVLQLNSFNLSSTGPRTAVLQKVKAAASLWTDPVLLMVAGINLTFGFSAAFMNGYINSEYTSPQLGSFAVTLLAAMTALFAGLFSHVFGYVSERVGKGPVVCVGALSFLGIPFCFFALKCCSGWDWALVVLYILQGSGRAVYESTNKGIFSDLFADNAPGAFANQILQVTGSFAICFFLSSSLKGPTLAWIALVLAAITPFGYFGAVALRKQQARRQDCTAALAANAA